MSLENLDKKEIIFLIEYSDRTFTDFELSIPEQNILRRLTDYSTILWKGEFIEEEIDKYGGRSYKVVNFSAKDVLLFLIDTLLPDEDRND